MRGWRMASRRALAPVSANTRLRMRARSSAPAASANSAPNSAMMAGIAGPCGAVRLWAIRSVSTMLAPRAANMSATVLLPLPMPPVRPMEKGSGRGVALMLMQEALGEGRQRRAVQQGDQAGGGQVGAERNRRIAAMLGHHHQRDADHRADRRRQQDDGRQHGPTHPRTQ